MDTEVSVKKRILCVENHLDTCDLIVALLNRYEIVCAHSLKQGMLRFRNQGFSAVIVDLHLDDPSGDGLSFCRQIRSIDEKIPIVMMTVDYDLSLEDAKAAGAQMLLRKGRDFSNDLKNAVDRLVFENSA